MITVEIYCEETLRTREMAVADVDPFIELIKKYGFMDTEGNEYKFSMARMENDVMVVCVDLE